MTALSSKVPKYIWFLLISVNFIYLSAKAQNLPNIVKEKCLVPDTIRIGFKNIFLISPTLSYSPETSVSFGGYAMYYFMLGEKESCTHPSRIETRIAYTLKKQFWIEPEWEIYTHLDNYYANGNILYQQYRELFFGLGNNTPDTASEEYAYSLFQLHALVQKRLVKRLFLGPVYHFENMFAMKTEAGGLFQDINLTGNAGSLVSGVGAVISWDSRDLSLTPMEGSFISFSTLRFGKGVGSQYAFTQYAVDARKYFPLYNHKHVLATQLLYQSTVGDAPFRMLPALGGKDIMRGYYTGRFRAGQMLVTQAEYRFPVYWRIGATVFGGAARLADAFGDFAFNHLHYNYGFGLRYMYNRKERINIRLDFGFGPHTNGQYITIGEAF